MHVLRDWLIQSGWSPWTATAAAIAASLAAAYLTGRILRALFKAPLFRKLKHAQDWRDAISSSHLMSRWAGVIATVVAYYLVLPLLDDWPNFQVLTGKTIQGILVLTVAAALGAMTKALVEVLAHRDSRDQRLPFKALGQGLQLTIWTYAAVALLSVITGQNVGTVLTGLTAIGAVLVYVFRDPLLGWSAGLQVASNDLVRVGDWISIPKHDTDGIVQEIALTTVKVQNWDKTISTVPTYSLVSVGFQNWRGMYASRVRRIKRSVPIDAASVRFCDGPLLERLGRDPLLKEFLQPEDASTDAIADNGIAEPAPAPEAGADPHAPDRPTNLGCFRAWLEAWLTQHPKIDERAIVMVRELPLAGRGIPVEIYVFSKDQRWTYYEKLQAEIIDHVVAILPEFDLRVFQEPMGDDLRTLAGSAAPGLPR